MASTKYRHIVTLSMIAAERRGRVVNTPASYSGGLGFKYRALRPTVLTGSSWIASVPGKCWDSSLT
jgi:hypothetical protein